MNEQNRIHTSPLRRGVKWTPRNGNAGSGTGYMLPLINLAFSGFNSKYSPRNGIIFGSDEQPVNAATLSE